VTPEQRQSILALLFEPVRGRTGSPEQVLQQFGTDDGQALGLDLLRDATRRRDWPDLQAALIACFTFGFTTGHLDLLIQLAGEDWHFGHEDVVNGLEDVVAGLDEQRTRQVIGALAHMARWVPPYLDWDENRALARNAIWAMGKIPGPAAAQALTGLLDSDSEIVRRRAAARRAGDLPWSRIAWACDEMDRLLAPDTAAHVVINVAEYEPDLWVPAGTDRLISLLEDWDDHRAERQRIDDQIREHLRSLREEDIPADQRLEGPCETSSIKRSPCGHQARQHKNVLGPVVPGGRARGCLVP
jgi:HEAT repeats